MAFELLRAGEVREEFPKRQKRMFRERGKELWELKEKRILENDCDQYCKLMSKSGNTRTEKYPLTLANKTHCNSKSNYSL